MIREEDVYKIGRLGKPHGVSGVMTFMFSDDVFSRVAADYLFIRTDGVLVPFFIEECQLCSDDTALLKLCGIDTVERARDFTNCEVLFPKSLADNGGKQDNKTGCEGFSVISADDGSALGTVVSIDDTTANILLNIQRPGGRMLLLPAVDEFIKSVDASGRLLTVKLPDGLLDL